MKKVAGILVVLAVALTLGSAVVNAQTQITLGPTASGSISFNGSGGNVSINLGTLVGGSALLPPGSDGYTMVQSGAISLSSTGSIFQANPIAFSYSNGSGGTLTGSLELVNFAQLGSLGLFNDNLVANLANLGGTLASNFGSTAVLDITVVVQNGANVWNLFSSNGTDWAHISSGEVVPTPETSTLVLFGAGLVAIGLLMLRRMGTQAHQVASL
jgi:hypothetical protein